MKEKIKRVLIMLVVTAGLVAVDQAVKEWTVMRLKGQPAIAIWPDVFELTYVENRGAAFGILKNQRILFLIITILVVGAVIFYIIYKKPQNKLLLTSLGMISGGGIGNLIDRIRLSYVVDFIDVRIINYPVFNVADSFVVVGAVLFIIYIMFYEGKESGRNNN